MSAQFHTIKTDTGEVIMATPMLIKGMVAVFMNTDECSGVIYLKPEQAKALYEQLSASINVATNHGEERQ